jgi:hypothetical protein
MRVYGKGLKALALAGIAAAAIVGAPFMARSADTGVPSFTYDGSWPKLPLPNKWTFDGLTVD